MKRFSCITTTQLARICGVSQGTVDRALHNRPGISAKTKERILEVAKEYAYDSKLPSKGGRSMLIGVILFDLYNEFFSKLAMSMVEQAKKCDYSVIFLFSNKNFEAEKSALEYFNYIGVDEIVLFSIGSDSEDYKSYLKSIKRPLVTIGNRLFDLPYIGVDDYKAMYDLTNEVLKYTNGGKVEYFAPILRKELHSLNSQKIRHLGYIDAMKAAQLDFHIATNENELSDESDGVIASADHYVLRIFQRFGYKNNKTIAGFDNVSILHYLDKKIVTVEYSTDEIATECLNYLLKRKYRGNIDYSITINE